MSTLVSDKKTKSRIYFIQKTKGFACITTIRRSDHAVQEMREIFLSLSM